MARYRCPELERTTVKDLQTRTIVPQKKELKNADVKALINSYRINEERHIRAGARLMAEYEVCRNGAPPIKSDIGQPIT